MATFSQWWKSFSIKGEVRQLTWVCGSELVLVDEVVRSIRESLDPDPWDYVPLNAEEMSEDEIWSNILQYPISASPRLVVVREAQSLKDTSRITDLVKKRRLLPNTYVIFVSSDSSLPKGEDGKERASHVKAFSGKGYVIECKPFTQATAKYAVSWVQGKKQMRSGVAAHLLSRANGDLRLTRDLCHKLALFPQEPTMTMVNELLREHPRDSLTNALLALDRKTALLALEVLDPGDYSAVIGSLDANLELAGLVHDMLVAHKPTAEISKAAGSRRFLVPDLLPVARHYGPKRRASIRRSLAEADEALQRGEKTAILESVITFW